MNIVKLVISFCDHCVLLCNKCAKCLGFFFFPPPLLLERSLDYFASVEDEFVFAGKSHWFRFVVCYTPEHFFCFSLWAVGTGTRDPYLNLLWIKVLQCVTVGLDGKSWIIVWTRLNLMFSTDLVHPTSLQTTLALSDPCRLLHVLD